MKNFLWYVLSCEKIQKGYKLVISRYFSPAHLVELLNQKFKENLWQHNFLFEENIVICNISARNNKLEEWIKRSGYGINCAMAFINACSMFDIRADNCIKTVISDKDYLVGTTIIPKDEKLKAEKELNILLEKFNFTKQELTQFVTTLGISSIKDNHDVVIDELNKWWNHFENEYSIHAYHLGEDLEFYLKKYNIETPKKDRQTILKTTSFLQFGKFIFQNKVEVFEGFENYYLPDFMLPFHMRGKGLLVNGKDLGLKQVKWTKQSKEDKSQLSDCSPRFWIHRLANDPDDPGKKYYGESLLKLYPSKKKETKRNALDVSKVKE